MPKSYFVNERIGDAQRDHVEAFGEEIVDPTRLRQIATRQAQIYSEEHASTGKEFTFPRCSSGRHRVN